MEYMEEERELSEEEIINVQGGFPHMLGNIHPFEDEELYGESQKEKIQKLKEQLEELEKNKTNGSRRR